MTDPLIAADKTSAHILVVDDDASIRKVFKKGIQQAGYRCTVAANARQGLAELDKHPIDLVISDINMPGMNGIELGRIVHDRYDADLVIMTGYGEDFTYEAIMEIGASDFIRKPVTLSEFTARLRRVLAERRTRRERNAVLKQLEINLDRYRRAMNGIVHAMSLATEMRDPYTAGHQHRVATLAVAIAEKLGLADDKITGLKMVSDIHDLGKLIVPVEILCKPGRLTDLEYALIQTHAKAGYDILKTIEFPWPLAQMVLQHHERLDGSGYPNGLKGDAILFETRILSVADVMETMANHRPYRPALGIETAVAELQQHRDRLYDGDVVDACVAVVSDPSFDLTETRAASQAAILSALSHDA